MGAQLADPGKWVVYSSLQIQTQMLSRIFRREVLEEELISGMFLNL